MNPPTQKPLSEKPVGYLLSLIGGTLGAPIGWIASPIVLWVLNKTLKSKNGKKPKRFLFWSLIGIAGAPISLGASLLLLYIVLPPAPYDPEPGVNRDKYDRLQTGMTVREVETIVGESAEDIFEDQASGGEIYVFGDRFERESIDAVFKDGRLLKKVYRSSNQ